MTVARLVLQAGGGVSEKKGRAALDTAPHPMRKKFLFHEKVNLPTAGPDHCSSRVAAFFWSRSGLTFRVKYAQARARFVHEMSVTPPGADQVRARLCNRLGSGLIGLPLLRQ